MIRGILDLSGMGAIGVELLEKCLHRATKLIPKIAHNLSHHEITHFTNRLANARRI